MAKMVSPTTSPKVNNNKKQVYLSRRPSSLLSSICFSNGSSINSSSSSSSFKANVSSSRSHITNNYDNSNTCTMRHVEKVRALKRLLLDTSVTGKQVGVLDPIAQVSQDAQDEDDATTRQQLCRRHRCHEDTSNHNSTNKRMRLISQENNGEQHQESNNSYLLDLEVEDEEWSSCLRLPHLEGESSLRDSSESVGSLLVSNVKKTASTGRSNNIFASFSGSLLEPTKMSETQTLFDQIMFDDSDECTESENKNKSDVPVFSLSKSVSNSIYYNDNGNEQQTPTSSSFQLSSQQTMKPNFFGHYFDPSEEEMINNQHYIRCQYVDSNMIKSGYTHAVSQDVFLTPRRSYC